ncbi:MAG: heavy metal translocating P-type ATPase [Planctomycetes bacterium]|nr:heavy metal translocating P-type ATPase [Planctomycetota bacterium]
MSERVQLRIIGMTCGGCAGRVESALRGVAGVREAVVNLMGESATLLLDSAGSKSALIEAVRGAGYDAEILSGGRQLLDRMAGDSESRETLRRHRQGLIQAIGLALPIMILDHAMHILWGHTFEKQVTARYMQLILLVMMSVSPGAGPILAGGLRAIWHRIGNMDVLITLGVLTATGSSIYGIVFARDASFIHIDAASMILALVCVGRYLEARAKARATQAMTTLANRAPRQALVRKNGQWVSTPVERIAIGDEITVPPHESIPVDGEVIEGEAAVDESLMTGEPMPQRRVKGDSVLGGSLAIEGQIVIRATTTGARSALGRIVELVQKAQATRTESQRTADRVAAVFVPIVLTAAALTFIGWLFLSANPSASNAVRAAAAVLVVACPCALGLATPTVVTVATGLAALRGILVRDAATLEAAGKIDVVLWDKTGTLTAGKPAVMSVTTTGISVTTSAMSVKTAEPISAIHPNEQTRLAQPQRGREDDARTQSVETRFTERDVLRFAAGAEQFSSHPLAKSIVAEARRRLIAVPDATDFQVAPGSGVEARVEGRWVVVGRENFVPENNLQSASTEETESSTTETNGATIANVWIDGHRIGTIALRDTVRPSARAAIQRLARLGVQSEMLTGDHRAAAMAVAHEVGLKDSAVNAGVKPHEKLIRVKLAKENGSHCVAMVGDGLNDAAALAAADVGIAFAAGAQAANDAAGIQLIGSTPQLVADAVELARAAMRIIRQNLFWAFVYNLIMIPFAATGLLPPMAAAGAMMISSLTVVLNALRLPRVFARKVA